MPHAELPTVRLHYGTEGEAGTPVLLVMGFGVPGAFWRAQVPTLATRHRVVWFDNRGTGQTEITGRARASVNTMAEDAVGLLDALGWDDAHVVGVSMGGMIAQEIALQFRGRTRSLALIATHAGGLRAFVPTPEGLSLFVRGNLARSRRARAEAMERLIYPQHFLETIDRDRLHSVLHKDGFGAVPLRHRAAQLAAVLRHRTKDRLAGLEGLPTLVVQAGQDVLIRAREVQRLHRLIPGARLEVFEDAGHGILGQCAARLNELLLEHFAEADTSK